MDFLDPKKKRNQQVKLFVGYALMATLLTVATIFLWFFSFGFNFDPKTNSVIQNGLIFIDSHPESATVLVNGQDKGQTDARMVLPAGNYDLELRREGYRSWKHGVALEGSTIERLIYPFLFPTKLVSDDAETFSAVPTLASQSPDRKWLIVHQSDVLSNFTVTDLSKEKIKATVLSIPESVLNKTGVNHLLTPVEWSTDNKHLVIKHEYDGGSEFVLIDRESADKAVNLNKHFGIKFSDMSLRDKKFDRYYLHDKDTGDLVDANLDDKKTTQIASKVLSFQPHGDDIILYATDLGKSKDNVTVIIKDGNKSYTLRELPKSQKYLLDLARFNGKWYIAAGSSEDQRVYIYVDPFNDLKRNDGYKAAPNVLLRLNQPLEYLSFSANARFIAVQGGSSFAVYDSENKRQFRYDTNISIEKGQEATWIDGHRLNLISDKKLVIFDFDGTNIQTLLGVSSNNFAPFFDRDYNNLFTVSPSVSNKEKTALVHTNMKYEPNKTNQ